MEYGQTRGKLLTRFLIPFTIYHLPFAILLLLLSGCQVLGVLAYKVHGPPKVPAQYVPAKKPMLVLVENYEHQSSVNAHADLLAHMLVKELGERKIAPLVSLETLQALRDDKPAEFPKMSMASIGREVGADQILYVQLHRSDVTPMAGGNSLTGQTAASVKVVDVPSGDTLWPGGAGAEAGYPVAAATKLGTNSGANVADVRQRMYAQLSHDIAKLFYKWQPEEDEPEGFEN
jgi:hypothetical protein